MKNAKALNIKNMKETLVNYCGGDIGEYNRIWDSFYNMVGLGFISNDMWKKFYEQTAGWVIDGDFLKDIETGEVIFDFDNGARHGRDYKVYHA